MRVFLHTVAALVMAAAIAAPSWAGPIEEISALQKGMKTVSAPFTQKKMTELLARPIKSKGTFYFKQGAGVRWVYDGQMVVVYDGVTLWLHYTEMDEAEKVKGIAGFSGPLSFDVVQLKKDYVIKAAREASGDIALELKPKVRMPFVSMRMVFAGGEAFPREVTVREESGDETVITFAKTKLNVKLKDSLFVFKPPRGVTVKERQFQ